jgi:HPr kinase/phosphorylase
MTILQIHASCVAFGDRAVLIRGKPGSGKSSLVLRLIDAEGFGLGDHPMRAKLVADDQVILSKIGEKLYAGPPQTIAGKLEIRGQGIVALPWVENIHLHLVVDLVPVADIVRMPELDERTTNLCGIAIPRLALDATWASAPAQIRSFLV